jgi:hypothetical protein
MKFIDMERSAEVAGGEGGSTDSSAAPFWLR